MMNSTCRQPLVSLCGAAMTLLLTWSASTSAGLTASAAYAQPLLVEPVEVNRVVLRVNDRIATLYDFQNRVAVQRSSLLSNPEIDPAQRDQLLADLPKAVFRRLWEDLLIASRADQLGVLMTEQEVEEAVLDQMRRFQIQDIEQFRMALAREGMTLAAFRNSLRDQMLFREVMSRELFPRIQVSEDELRSIYRDRAEDFQTKPQARVRELVVLDDGALQEAEQQKVAREIRELWLTGAEPSDLAEARGDSVRLLEIGWVSEGDLAPALEQAIEGLEEGAVAMPVAARGGLHVVQIMERKAAETRPFEEVRAQLMNEERGRRMSVEQGKYLQELEERAYYRAFPPPGLEDFQTAGGRSLDAGGLRMLEELTRSADDRDAAARVAAEANAAAEGEASDAAGSSEPSGSSEEPESDGR